MKTSVAPAAAAAAAVPSGWPTVLAPWDLGEGNRRADGPGGISATRPRRARPPTPWGSGLVPVLSVVSPTAPGSAPSHPPTLVSDSLGSRARLALPVPRPPSPTAAGNLESLARLALPVPRPSPLASPTVAHCCFGPIIIKGPTAGGGSRAGGGRRAPAAGSSAVGRGELLAEGERPRWGP